MVFGVLPAPGSRYVSIITVGYFYVSTELYSTIADNTVPAPVFIIIENNDAIAALVSLRIQNLLAFASGAPQSLRISLNFEKLSALAQLPLYREVWIHLQRSRWVALHTHSLCQGECCLITLLSLQCHQTDVSSKKNDQNVETIN